MKTTLLLCLILSQVACVSALIPHDPRPANSYAPAQFAAEKRQENAGNWAVWDAKYVSDDTLVIEVFDENGRRVLSGTAK